MHNKSRNNALHEELLKRCGAATKSSKRMPQPQQTECSKKDTYWAEEMMMGTRIKIREHVLADLDAYSQWQSDPEIARHVAWLPRTHEESEASLLDAISQQTARPRVRFFFAVVRRGSGEVLGDVGFAISAAATGDCGWFIRKEYWGFGFAAEAVKLMMEYAFQTVGLDRLTASCSVANPASERVMIKCGFQCVGKTATRASYDATRNDWRRKAQPAR